jgi:hypothetical protein
MRLGIVPDAIALNPLPVESPTGDLSSDGSCGIRAR